MFPAYQWEGTIWNEAPYVIKVGKKYVLMYSARGFFEPSYAVGYAVANFAMGPWIKAEENPVLKRSDMVSGPGHNCIVDSPDGKEKLIMYHVHKYLGGGWERELAIDRIDIIEEAGTVKLVVHGPTNTPQQIPSCAK